MLELWRPKTTIDKLFDDFFTGTDIESYYSKMFTPNVVVRETEDHILIESELPGMKKEDVKVTYENGAIVISGEKMCKKSSEEDKILLSECTYGKFKRAIPLNQDYIIADKIDANFKDGVLHIEIAKAEQTKPKLIDVHVK